ncbi:MAG: hypothetical protein IPQ07_33365 [Myxococcales bacterium]|nr:hypothetical protein [Myxococcales bacterium]
MSRAAERWQDGDDGDVASGGTLMIEVGATYAFRIAPGESAICRALRVHDTGACLVVMAWRGPSKTPFARMARSVRFHRPQLLSEHPGQSEILGYWVELRDPEGMRLFGVVPPTAAERRIARRYEECTPRNRQFLGWGPPSLLIVDARVQWQREHQPEKLAAAFARSQRAIARRAEDAEAAQARRRTRQRTRGPQALAKRRWFASFAPDKRDPCRTVLAAAVAELIAMADRTPARAALALARAMRKLSKLDDRRSFDTVDAEELVEALAEVGDSCGVDEALFDRVVDRERSF